MNTNKIKIIEEHLKSHPRDYQSIISLFKIKSEHIEYEKRQEQIKRIKLLKEIERGDTNG